MVYNNLGQTARKPDEWKQLMALVDESSHAGIRAYPLCTPNSTTQLFSMRNCQLFGSPTWHPILLASDADKLRAYSDPAVRRKLHEEVVDGVLTCRGQALPGTGTITCGWKHQYWRRIRA